jgi:hypothetical protein
MTDDVLQQTQIKYHSPEYVELYLYNRLEQEQSRAMFADLLYHAIHSNGGRIYEAMEESNEADRKQMEEDIAKFKREQEEQRCMQLAIRKETYTSEVDQQESMHRLEAQQGTERDLRLAKRRDIVNTYLLQKVSMMHEPTTTEEAVSSNRLRCLLCTAPCRLNVRSTDASLAGMDRIATAV